MPASTRSGTRSGESSGAFRGRSGVIPPAVQHGAAAPQRHRRAAHRSRPQPDPAGHRLPLETDDRPRRAVAAGHRPCGHRDPERRREAPRRRGDRPARARPGGVPGTGVGVEPAEPRHHHESDAHPRVVGRLEPRALHPRRRPVAGGPAGVRDPLSRGADLSRQVHRELVHPVPDRAVRSRGRARGAGGPALSRALPGGRRRRRGYGRHHPAGDHGGGHRGGGASGRRAVPWPDRPDGAPADHRSRIGGGRRRVRRRGVRDRRRQGDAGPRPQRLRDGPAARSAPGGGHRRGRPDDRRGGAVRRPGPVRGAGGDRGAARGGGPAGTRRGPPACGRALQPLPDGGRAAGVDPVVRPDQAVGRARDCRGRGRPHPLRARELGPHLLRVDDQHPRLVHLAPALVGAPGARLVLRSVRVGARGGGSARGLWLRRPAAPGHGRAGHLVQLRTLAVQHHGVAGPHRGSRAVLSDQRHDHRARHHLLLDRADDDAGHEVRRRRPVQGHLHHVARAGRARAEDEQVEGQRRQSPAGDGGDRRRRLPVHPRRARVPPAWTSRSRRGACAATGSS